VPPDCPEGKDPVLTGPITHKGKVTYHSMVYLCRDGDCKWYQKCGFGDVSSAASPPDAFGTCGMVEESGGQRTCSCVPSPTESCSWD
jgi:hypothetical protein